MNGYIILNSVNRVPPFEKGKTEKGFRDSIILEELIQLVEASPNTPAICSIAIVTGDELLRSAVTVRLNEKNNVYIFQDIEELKGLINTLASKVDELYIQKIQKRATEYFYKKNENKSLYVRKKIGDMVRQQFTNKLEEIPESASERENGTWYISPPNFVRKEGQCITWSSLISVEAKAYIYTNEDISPYSTVQFSQAGLSASITPLLPVPKKLFPTLLETFVAGSPSPYTPAGIGMSGLIQPSSIYSNLTKKVIKKGRTVFEVIWSFSISSEGRFTRSKINEIKYLHSIWE
ncbi:MAG: hypothetical protein HZA08_05545 [Nitrospirae bacterium]|nr:hypothetical protein [Nitrospirota bacterium]